MFSVLFVCLLEGYLKKNLLRHFNEIWFGVQPQAEEEVRRFWFESRNFILTMLDGALLNIFTIFS